MEQERQSPLSGIAKAGARAYCLNAMEPLIFSPLYMERVWGGRELARVYGRDLPSADKPYGESWEIVDREAEQSVVSEGPLAGKTLNELWTQHREEIFGSNLPDHPRFPILIKILDARDDLSIQVHPPQALAPQLGGEPKTEMWFIADCDADAKLYVGLKNGVTRGDFEQAIADGSVAEVVHAIHPKPGDSIFIPSGRLHAIGAGFLIHEIQQNSDTTYRVFDWNRVGLDGKPRELHVDQSLASIDFDDFEPGMDEAQGSSIAACEYFTVDRIEVPNGGTIGSDGERFVIVSVIDGSLRSAAGRTFGKGETLLLPCKSEGLHANENSICLLIHMPVDQASSQVVPPSGGLLRTP